MNDRWMIYGAYGYSGDLVARQAVARGERPLLAGRDPVRLELLARELDLEHVALGLHDTAALHSALDRVSAVAHCAGPFSSTSRAMVDACLATGTHYLDITGEIAVFEEVFARDVEARAAGITLLPGAGFDVVPTDCLAALVVAELPAATRLDIAFQAGGGMSRGTMRTALESAGSPTLGRVDGRIAPVPSGLRRGTITLGRKPTAVSAISWGDVSTAFHSTGIPNITVYIPMAPVADYATRIVSAAKRSPSIGSLTSRMLGAVVDRARTPSAHARAMNNVEVWVQASDASGSLASARLTAPNGYDLTADSVVRIARQLALGDIATGALTPSQALGADYIRELDGVVVLEEPHRH